MAPSVSSPKPIMAAKSGSTRTGSRIAGVPPKSREATPSTAKPGPPVAVVKSNIELDSVFKTDLTNIRSLITCSICDQLLYEPWTLGCGHTYCYSCLCNWFVPNRRKKTCPECRDVVKQVPAPSFLVKQLVEIFMKRSELMPSDESVEQHQKKRAEETEDVERDKNSPNGLFKGAFPPRNRDLIFDEEDGVLRCPRCLTEHEGGPTCTNCSLPVDNAYDFSDIDEDQFDGEIDVEDLELEMDSELAGPYHHHFGPFIGIPHFGFQHFPHHHHHHHHGESVASNSEEDDFSEGGSEDDEDADEDDSLQDFVVRDDLRDDTDSPRPEDYLAERTTEERLAARYRFYAMAPNNANPITISDDESDDDSDEGGAVRAHRPRRPAQASRAPRVSRPTVIDLSSSETEELGEDATMLRNAGWNPLRHELDSDAEVSEENYGYDDEGDTDTIGNPGTDHEDDEDDDRSRSELSQTPTSHYFYDEQTPSNISEGGYDDPDDSDGSTPSAVDRDGDTEMSASPRASRMPRSPSVDLDSYGYGRSENLGVTTQVYNVDEDSSDDSVVRPAPRRRPRATQQNARISRYNPWISSVLAEHQQNIRGVQAHHHPVLGELDGEAQRVEPASRSRRTNGYRYRAHPPRHGDPLRSPTYPSVDRVISSSMRAARSPRHYHIRN